jgi:hypothetical protein
MTSNSTHAHTSPLKKVGALDDKFKFEETTPVVGREYPELDLVNDVLNASNAEELIRDLAITSTFSCTVDAALAHSRSFGARCGLFPRARQPHG